MRGAPDRFTLERQRACEDVVFHGMLIVPRPDFHGCFVGSDGVSKWEILF